MMKKFVNARVFFLFLFSVVFLLSFTENVKAAPLNMPDGTVCSHGCVRLTVEDAQWIYENCEAGTIVEIYDDADNPGPLGKPEAQKLDGNNPRHNWDPTDTDPGKPRKQE